MAGAGSVAVSVEPVGVGVSRVAGHRCGLSDRGAVVLGSVVGGHPAPPARCVGPGVGVAVNGRTWWVRRSSEGWRGWRSRRGRSRCVGSSGAVRSPTGRDRDGGPGRRRASRGEVVAVGEAGRDGDAAVAVGVSVGVELPALVQGVVGGGVVGVEVRDVTRSSGSCRSVRQASQTSDPADAVFSAHRRQPGRRSVGGEQVVGALLALAERVRGEHPGRPDVVVLGGGVVVEVLGDGLQPGPAGAADRVLGVRLGEQAAQAWCCGGRGCPRRAGRGCRWGRWARAGRRRPGTRPGPAWS